jgi:hypothetical protein
VAEGSDTYVGSPTSTSAAGPDVAFAGAAVVSDTTSAPRCGVGSLGRSLQTASADKPATPAIREASRSVWEIGVRRIDDVK